jgi:hypothetical protein
MFRSIRSTLAALALTGSLLAGCSATRTAPTGPTAPTIVEPTRPTEPTPGPIDRAALRAKLAARRDVNVARFLAYRDAGIYPINTTGVSPNHVWMDPNANLCAAATIISGDWGRDATVAAILGNNNIRLADVHEGALHDWILTSGFTHHELVAIQAPSIDISQEEMMRSVEVGRLYAIYLDVERQLRSMWDQSLDDAADALMRNPTLARALLADQIAMPSPDVPVTPIALPLGYAQPILGG